MASSPSEREAAERLLDAQLSPLGWLPGASNQTLLVRLDDEPAPPPQGPVELADLEPSTLAVYKPDAGARPLWDFPAGTLGRREAAAFELSDWLGWTLVPATVHRDGPLGPGSVQRFVPHDPRRHYFALVDDGGHDDDLVRMAVFDMLANNADRKASHVLLDPQGRVFGIDQGLSFHVEPKLRTVIWDFAGAAIPESDLDDLRRLCHALESRAEAAPTLDRLLDGTEVAALLRRTRALLAARRLPDPPEDRRPYPWPLL
jgi:uncharacterized repeat protein (TIGR03843 family)